jgi:hypothetical protein
MKTVILKGVEIKIGSQVRFIDDRNLYSDVPTIIKPVVGNVYVVKGFSKNGGFLLETIDNPVYRFVTPEGNLIEICEPGFAVNRFEPARPLSKKKIVNIEIKPQVEERLYIPKKKKSKEKVKEEELELA